MKIVYFDCTNGISGDMAYMALKGLLDENEEGFGHEHHHGHSHGHNHKHNDNTHEHLHNHEHSHTSYADIKNIIISSEISESAKEKALSIYSVIAKAEALAHGTTIEDVHFHEVGRKAAIENIIGAAVCMDAIGADKVLCSEICDGTGFIECSHGTIPVPVPAVTAMRSECGLIFITDGNTQTEMVTPSGLAILIGLGARHSKEIPQGEILKKVTVFGKRKTSKDGGLTAYLIEI